MNWTAKSVVYGRTWMNKVLGALLVAPLAELIDTGFVRLSKDPGFSLTPGSLMATLEAQEADYSGYAAGGKAYVVGAPVNLSPTIQGTMTSLLYTATAATPFVAASVYGWWIDDGTDFVVGEAFGNGVVCNFGAPGDFLQLDVATPFGLYQPTGII